MTWLVPAGTGLVTLLAAAALAVPLTAPPPPAHHRAAAHAAAEHAAAEQVAAEQVAAEQGLVGETADAHADAATGAVEKRTGAGKGAAVRTGLSGDTGKTAVGVAARVRGGVAEPVPCPMADTTLVEVPERPEPPQGDPSDRLVGGEQLATSGLVIPAGASPPPEVTATSWVVADLGSGAVLGACGPHEYGAPASVQKLLLMATLLAKLDPHEIVTVIEPDMDYEPYSSAAGLVLGGRYSVETLWLGLLLQSGNDAANVLARLGGGAAGAAGGVERMNQLAAHLGARQTHAVTPSGLDAPGQFTSAYDLALIARACFADETFRRYALTRDAFIPAQPLLEHEGFEIQNQNLLIDNYPGALGGKTGFTDLARHTYVGAARRDGRELVVTLLGAESEPQQGWEQGAALLDWGFAQPADAAVGVLVTPAAAEASPSAEPPAGSALVDTAASTSSPALAIVAVVTAVGAAFAAVARRRRRRR